MTTLDTADELGATADLRDEPWLVRQTLSALGRLLGASLVRPPRDLTSFVTGHLGVDAGEVAVLSSLLPGADAALVHVEVARALAGTTRAVLADDLGRGAPGYELVTVDVDEQVAAPDDLAAFLPAGEAFGFSAVLVLTVPNQTPQIALHVRRTDADVARGELAALIDRARNANNFYRGRTVLAKADDWSFSLTPIPSAKGSRLDVVHAAEVWAEVDANIGGLAKHSATLVAAGLGASRGVLVVGPPGVGKTALCRVIASELPVGTTVVIVDAAVTAQGLARIYETLANLAPAAVFLDDIDLIAGSRRKGGGGPELGEFLTHLDGFTPAAPVITVATTNAVTELDPALIRAGRFDAVIEIGPPGRAARAEILRRYLAPISTADVDPVAATTDGATGADLREIVRRTVLEHGADLTLPDLLGVVSSGRWKPAPLTGQYL